MRQENDDLLGFDMNAPPGSGEFDAPEAKPPLVRSDRFSVEIMADPKKMISWINKMRTVPLDGIDDEIVNETYAAAVWLFRKAAVDGDLKATSSMEKWLAWAKPIIDRPKKTQEPKPSKGSVAFLAREPKPPGEE